MGSVHSINRPASSNNLSVILGQIARDTEAPISRKGDLRRYVRIYSPIRITYTSGSDLLVVDPYKKRKKLFKGDDFVNYEVIKMLSRGGHTFQLLTNVTDSYPNQWVEVKNLRKYAPVQIPNTPLSEICGVVEGEETYSSESQEGGKRSKVTIHCEEPFEYTAGSDLNIVNSDGAVVETYEEEDIRSLKTFTRSKRSGYDLELVVKAPELDFPMW